MQLAESTSLPVLYSFRRCPYAIRARIAIHYAGISVNLREVDLKNKPAAMLAASPKGTVPVLIDTDGTIIDESLEIMHWALRQNDPDNWLDLEKLAAADNLIDDNDGDFKGWLDKYKYHVGYPEHPPQYYRDRCEIFFALLEAKLMSNTYLLGDKMTIADNAIFPFIRQCAFVDKVWFEQTAYSNLQRWLGSFLYSEQFLAIMKKHPIYC